MRPIDADKLIDFIKFDEKVIAPEEHTAQDIVMMIQTAPTIAQPPNDPLTLSELREMDGEPVWVVGVSSINNFKGHWDICSWESGDSPEFPYCGENPNINLYGIAWKAYRRKPEEGTT